MLIYSDVVFAQLLHKLIEIVVLIRWLVRSHMGRCVYGFEFLELAIEEDRVDSAEIRFIQQQPFRVLPYELREILTEKRFDGIENFFVRKMLLHEESCH